MCRRHTPTEFALSSCVFQDSDQPGLHGTFGMTDAAVARDPAQALLFTCLLYVYVVTVNKLPRNLWITVVYRSESARCRLHNRKHSVCDRGSYTRVTFVEFRRRPSYPVYVHSGSTRVKPVNNPVIHNLRWITGPRARMVNRRGFLALTHEAESAQGRCLLPDRVPAATARPRSARRSVPRRAPPTPDLASHKRTR